MKFKIIFKYVISNENIENSLKLLIFDCYFKRIISIFVKLSLDFTSKTHRFRFKITKIVQNRKKIEETCSQ